MENNVNEKAIDQDPIKEEELSSPSEEVLEKVKELNKKYEELLDSGEIESFAIFVNEGEYSSSAIKGSSSSVEVSFAMALSDLVSPKNFRMAKAIRKGVEEGLSIGAKRGLKNLIEKLSQAEKDGKTIDEFLEEAADGAFVDKEESSD